MPDGSADEEIIVRYTIEAQQAIADAQKFRAEVDQMKVALQQASADGKVAIKDLADAMIDTFAGKKMSEVITIGSKDEISMSTALAKKAISDYSNVVRTATKEIQADETAMFKALQTQSKTAYQDQINNQKLAEKGAKELYASMKNDSKEWNAFLKAQEAQEAQIRKENALSAIANAKQQASIQKQLEKEVADEKKKDEAEWQSFLKAQAAQEKQERQQVAQNAMANAKQQANAVKYIEDAEKQASQSTKLFGIDLGNMGNIAKLVFGTVLGINAVQILQKIIRFFQDATQAGVEFGKSIYQLAVGVRALQRAGIDTTIQAWYDQIDALGKRFGIFSKVELVEGSAALANLLRDMKLTQEQIFNLQGAISTLAIVNGRAMSDVQRTVALALSSGYTEGLQRLGVSINRVTIAQKANELGFKGGYMALTEQQRALATYNLILEKTAKYSEDLAHYQNTAPGQIDKAKSAWKDFTSYLGQSALPALGMLANLLSILIRSVTEWGQISNKIFVTVTSNIVKPFAIAAQYAMMFWQNLTGKGQYGLQDFIDAAKQISKNIDQVNKDLQIGGPGSLGDTAVLAQDAQDQAQAIQDVVSKAQEDIQSIIDDAAQKRRDLAIDLQRDLTQIELDGQRKREDLARKHADDLRKIALDLSRDIDKENRSFAYDNAKLTQDTAYQRQQIEQKYRDQQLKDEAKFQEKMREMQENFLLDLEDAVRARNAKQIRRLTREYNLRREQAMRSHLLDTEDQRAQYEKDLADLRQQEARKRQELAIAHAQRLADIQLQHQQQIQEANIGYQQDLADLNRNLAQQRQDRITKYNQQLQDLARNINDRLRTIADGWTKEANLTAQGARAVYDALAAYFGQNGYIEQLYNYYVAMAQSKVAEVPKLKSQPNTITKSYAKGGMDVFSKPTNITVGDAGEPEIVAAYPMSKLSSILAGKLSPNASSSSMSGKLSVELLLSPDLEARIKENTLGEFVQVYERVNRGRG